MDNEEIQDMFEDLSFEDTIAHLKAMEDEKEIWVPFHLVNMYKVIQEIVRKDKDAQVATIACNTMEKYGGGYAWLEEPTISYEGGTNKW